MNPHRCLLNLIPVAEHAWSWKHFVTWVAYRQAVGLNCLCILWGCVPVYVGCPRPSTNAAIVLLSNDRWMNIEHWWNESDRKNGSTRRKTCPIAALFTENPTHVALIREQKIFLPWRLPIKTLNMFFISARFATQASLLVFLDSLALSMFLFCCA